MTTPTPPSTSAQYGALIGDYPASSQRLLVIIIGVAALLIALTGSIGNVEFDTGYRVIFFVLAIGCAAQFYYGYGAHAQLFERGFIISRSGTTTSGRWEDIAGVRDQMKKTFLFGFIPIPGTISHDYTIILANGTQVKIYNAYFSNAEKLGATIQSKWRQATANRGNSGA